ncbi:HAF repeat-containing PEP-CTERM protein [Caldimonas brevitalea]|uniref:Ice-binding protein C-terminal domain-containing protein n=1 Tax=Caldimonas brevitalea TaxID=413882 RepID=A0A0G3BRB1_9BURK|nr:HAF repeat-containing PEP-CTERM protein [Caldimonas brevitalea]AKJ31962.1 hypothetical protein AAW51_5271 [Caldimonas brevitalea]
MQLKNDRPLRHTDQGPTVFQPTRLLFSALLALAPLGAATASAQDAAGPRYTVTEIKAGTPAYVSVTSMNDLGEVVGDISDGRGGYHAFIWSPTTALRLLPPPKGATQTWASDINNSGQVAGSATVGEERHAFVYRDGVTTSLGTLGRSVDVRSINASGMLAGSLPNEHGQRTPFIYDGTSVRSLGLLPEFIRGEAVAINDRGQAVGSLGYESGPDSPMYYSDGQMNLLKGPNGEIIGSASDINEAGQVALWYGTLGDMDMHAAIWDAENGTVAIPLPENSDYWWSTPVAMNDAGDVLGRLFGRDVDARHFAYVDGETFELYTRLVPGMQEKWNIVSAHDINNRGQILVGAQLRGTDQYAALLLTPVPEPHTVALVFVGLGALAWRARVRRP